MIGKLTGHMSGVGTDGLAILEVGGVGYAVRMPQGSLLSLRAAPHSEISLFIHTAVREDALELYGFPTEEELAFFRQLMSVSGIGPKSALSILNTAEVAVLKRGIAAGDAASLTKVFGIGKKSAERIVVELREKVVIEVTAGAAGAASGSDAEVIEALMALGYSAAEARGALKEVGVAVEGSRARLAAALKFLGTRAAIS